MMLLKVFARSASFCLIFGSSGNAQQAASLHDAGHKQSKHTTGEMMEEQLTALIDPSYEPSLPASEPLSEINPLNSVGLGEELGARKLTTAASTTRIYHLRDTVKGDEIGQSLGSIVNVGGSTRVAAYQRYRDSDDKSSSVQVYEANSDKTEWSPLGSPLKCEVDLVRDNQPRGLIFSGDGSTVLVANAPLVSAYKYSDPDWELVGQPIEPPFAITSPATAAFMSISDDGMRIAIADTKMSGVSVGDTAVNIYEYSDANSQWLLIGSVVHQGFNPRRITMSGDGKSIALMYWYESSASKYSVVTYKETLPSPPTIEYNEWERYGSGLDIMTSDSDWKKSLFLLSYNGSRVVTEDEGEVKVYDLKDGVYDFAKIIGTFGWMGSYPTFALGKNDDRLVVRGQVDGGQMRFFTYDYSDGEWTLTGDDDGTYLISMSLSKDGNLLAAGSMAYPASPNYPHGEFKGRVRMWMTEFERNTVVIGDPHFVTWGGAHFFDYQGACEFILIDNDKLQLQMDSYDFGSWSGPKQLVLLWKETNEIVFHFDAAFGATNDGLVVNNVKDNDSTLSEIFRYNMLKEEFDDVLGNPNVHYFTFLGTGGHHFFRIALQRAFGNNYSIEIRGPESIFGGTKGMNGLWDEPGKLEYRDGKSYEGTQLFDSKQDADYNDIEFDYVKSWQINTDLGDVNFLNNPTGTCFDKDRNDPTTSAPTAVPNDESFNPSFSHSVPPTISPTIFPSLRRDRKSRSLQDPTDDCMYTCDDIKHPLMKLFCERDVLLSGSNDWACTPSYLDPVFDKFTDPWIDEESCPGGRCRVCRKESCKGDFSATERFPVTIDGVTKTHLCKWAARRETHKRCQLPEVQLHCCDTCCTECVGDAAGTEPFEIPERGEGFMRVCEWAGRKNKEKRCAIPTVARMCCMTCSD